MSYYQKYIKYKAKYLNTLDTINTNNTIDANNMIGGNKNKKCSIDEDDKVLFGDGGSSAIIIISKDKKTYKVFTNYNNSANLNKKNSIKEQLIKVDNEIKIYELLTKKIINKNISAHYVKYNGINDCINAKKLFADCPKTYTEFLNNDNNNFKCKSLYRNHPNTVLQEKYKVLEIEYCDYSCEKFIQDVSILPTILMEQYLDIFFFQIIYTIMITQKVFPYYCHNDLFIRNVLGMKEKDNGNHYTYKFGKKTFYVPQKIFFPKINDFGMTNLNDMYKDSELFVSEYKDVYNIMFDIYNGANLGSKSLMELCKDDPIKVEFLKSYFNNFFDVNIIDTYKEKSSSNMNWDWNNILDDDFLKSINMRNPKTLLNTYFYNIFGKTSTNINTYIS